MLEPAPPSLQSRATPASRWFAIGMVAAVVSVLGFTFWATAQPWFLFHNKFPIIRSMGFANRAAGRECQVLVAGDSTAEQDLTPAVIAARTGLKTCNIAEVRSLEDFMGMHYAIDEYLAHNPAPQFLVIALTPQDFNPEHAPLLSLNVESFAFAMQYRRGLWLWKAMLLHPREAFRFLTWAESELFMDAVGHGLRHRAARSSSDPRQVRDAASGFVADLDPDQTHCVGPMPHPDSTYAENAAGVAAFRAHYGRVIRHVLVLVTPVATCVPHLAEDFSLVHGLADNSLQALPVGLFNSGDIHLDTRHGALFSAQVADRIDAIRAQDGRDPASLVRAAAATAAAAPTPGSAQERTQERPQP